MMKYLIIIIIMFLMVMIIISTKIYREGGGERGKIIDRQIDRNTSGTLLKCESKTKRLRYQDAKCREYCF